MILISLRNRDGWESHGSQNRFLSAHHGVCGTIDGERCPVESMSQSKIPQLLVNERKRYDPRQYPCSSGYGIDPFHQGDRGKDGLAITSCDIWMIPKTSGITNGYFNQRHLAPAIFWRVMNLCS
jgi:hypothetical protein